MSFYRTIDQLENVGDTESILQEELNEQYKEAENLEPNNLLYEGEIIPNNTELKNQEITLKKFKDILPSKYSCAATSNFKKSVTICREIF